MSPSLRNTKSKRRIRNHSKTKSLKIKGGMNPSSDDGPITVGDWVEGTDRNGKITKGKVTEILDDGRYTVQSSDSKEDIRNFFKTALKKIEKPNNPEESPGGPESGLGWFTRNNPMLDRQRSETPSSPKRPKRNAASVLAQASRAFTPSTDLWNRSSGRKGKSRVRGDGKKGLLSGPEPNFDSESGSSATPTPGSIYPQAGSDELDFQNPSFDKAANALKATSDFREGKKMESVGEPSHSPKWPAALAARAFNASKALLNRDSAKKRWNSVRGAFNEGRLSGQELESDSESVNSAELDEQYGETYPHKDSEQILDVQNPSLDPKLTEIEILKSELGDVENKLDSFKGRLDSLEKSTNAGKSIEDVSGSESVPEEIKTPIDRQIPQRLRDAAAQRSQKLRDAYAKFKRDRKEKLQNDNFKKLFKQAEIVRPHLTPKQWEQLNNLRQSFSPVGVLPGEDNESSSDTHLSDRENASDSGDGSALDRVSSSSDYETPENSPDEDNEQPSGQPQSTSFNNPSVINEEKIIKFIQDYDEKYKDTDRPLRDNLDQKEIKQILEKTTDNDVHDCSRQEFEKTDYGSTCHWAKNKEGNYCHNPSRSFGGNEENCKTKGIMGVLTKQQAAEKIAKEIRAAYNTTRRNASRVTNPKAGAKKTKKSNKQQSSKSSKRNIKNKKKISHRTVKN